MDRIRFYELIEDASDGSDDGAPSADAGAVSAALDALEDEEVLQFVRLFEQELVRLNRWTVWGAGYVAAGGMSDDSFHYFRAWLIGKGSEAVQVALTEPDGLADYLDGGDLENEALEYAALELLDDRGLEDPRLSDAGSHADDEPEGEPFDELSAEAAYPRITAQRAQLPGA